jgi:DNA-binding winged helix-turn-helix (wHTH) protein/Flp pilus assembly protein TadD
MQVDQTIGRSDDATAIVLAHQPPFRLGALEVRPGTRELIGPNGRQILEPRVMKVLVALARADGRILTRDDLTRSCWDGRIVGEDAISRVISRLRRALLSVDAEGWVVETLTKVGYRLQPAGEAPGDAAPPAQPQPRPSRRLWLASAAAMAAVGAGGVLIWRQRRRPPREAVVLFDKANEALRQGVPEQNAQAVAFLREAVAEAPDYADAWGALALAYQANLLYTAPDQQGGVFTRASAAARRALELDPDNPRGAAAMALLTPMYRNWEAADAHFDRAMRLYRGQAVLSVAYSKLLLSVGRVRGSVTAAQDAVDADPFAPFFRFALAYSLWGAGRTEEAELVLGKALTRWPRQYALWFLQLHLWSHTGRADRAVALAQDLGNRPIGIPTADVELSLSAARAMASRAPAEIARAVEIQMAAARRGVGFAENAMGWLSAFGRVDDAFAIGRAMYFDEGFSIGQQRFSRDQNRFVVGRKYNTHHLFMPPTTAMRRDPRWPRLMADLDIARYWKTTGRGPDDPAWARSA